MRWAKSKWYKFKKIKKKLAQYRCYLEEKRLRLKLRLILKTLERKVSIWLNSEEVDIFSKDFILTTIQTLKDKNE